MLMLAMFSIDVTVLELLCVNIFIKYIQIFCYHISSIASDDEFWLFKMQPVKNVYPEKNSLFIDFRKLKDWRIN